MAYQFGIDVKVKLMEKGHNLSWLANKLKVSNGYVSDILNGNRKPKAKIEQIKNILDME